MAEKLMAGDAEAVVNAVVTAAKEGDMTAARLVLDRIAPPCRGRPVRLDLPPIVSAADLVKALAAVADAMARGVLSAEEAQAAAAVLEHHRKAVETFDLERRITAIENMQKPNER
jgi:ribosomal protein L17